MRHRFHRRDVAKGLVARTCSGQGLDTRTMALLFLERLLPKMELSGEIFDVLIPLLPRDVFCQLSRETIRLWQDAPDKRRMEADVKESEMESPDAYGSAVESLLICKALSMPVLQHMVLSLLKETLAGLSHPLANCRKQVEEIRAVYRLNEQELEALLFFYTLEQQSDFEGLFSGINITVMIEMLKTVLDTGSDKVREILSSRGRLIASGLIGENYQPHTSGHFPDVDPGIREYLGGLIEGRLSERFVRRDGGARYPLAGFKIPAVSLAVMRSLLAGDKPAHILLYGRPGTGKTELARSLAASTGKPVFVFRDKKDDAACGLHRSGLIAAADRVARDDGILILDETDRFLQTERQGLVAFLTGTSGENQDKGWLNSFLDSAQNRIIWITNRTGGIDDSVKRRFDFSLMFRDFDRQQRLSMWKIQSRVQGVRLPLHELARLAAEYPVNAGPIATALKGVAATATVDQADVLPLLREILTRQLELQGRTCLPDRTSTCRSYDPAALRLDTDRMALEESLRGCTAHLESLPPGDVFSMNFLFWGPSGTGKTEYARYLAGLLGRELVFKRASDLFNPYVGMTEQNIREMFRTASQQQAILFVDEADSFLRTREKASRSWELSFVNEFLTNMENFRGILICCTNLREELDPASLRRFQWKVGFQALDAAGRERLFRKYFHPRGALSKPLRERLAGMDGLVPGDFHAVNLRLGFLSAAAKQPELVLAELDKERVLRKGKQEPVGFACGKA